MFRDTEFVGVESVEYKNLDSEFIKARLVVKGISKGDKCIIHLGSKHVKPKSLLKIVEHKVQNYSSAGLLHSDNAECGVIDTTFTGEPLDHSVYVVLDGDRPFNSMGAISMFPNGSDNFDETIFQDLVKYLNTYIEELVLV